MIRHGGANLSLRKSKSFSMPMAPLLLENRPQFIAQMENVAEVLDRVVRGGLFPCRDRRVDDGYE